MVGWRRNRAVAVAGLLLFLTFQLGIPPSRMAGSGDIQRFGWQMFSTVGERIEFNVHTDDGVRPVVLEEFVARARADIPFDVLLPPHLCAVIVGAEAVTWDESEYRC